ncbi:MAG: amidohydrolase family protein [Chloroflexota bacterium]|nr:amidohydrolase family protein [Chloroflexota bacterium]
MPPRIDAHQHFWRYAPDSHAWIDESMGALKRDLLPEDLAPLLRDAGFDGCIAVQAQQSVTETEWLLQLAGEHDFIRGVVGWVDLCAPDVSDPLRRLSANRKLRGIRHIVQDEPDDRFMLRPDFMRGIAALAEFDLAYDILIYPRQMPAAVELAQAFPQQRFVLDHLGKPEIRAGEFDRWARGIAALSRKRNVSAKLSGLVTEADWHAWSPDDFIPYLDVAMDWFGPERLMIGSDWPVCTLAGAYADVVAVVQRYIARLAPEQQDEIMGGTAARVYRV